MNLECPECGSNDVDVAPNGAGGDFQCQECGHLFCEEDIDA